MKKELWNNDWLFYTETNTSPKEVTLPHDAMLVGERSPMSAGKDAIGYFTGDVYHYQKKFSVSRTQGTHFSVLFDGVYQNSTVLLNGKTIGSHHYGYTPFEINLDSTISFSEINTLEVIADNSKLPNSRWYSGGGIYRDVFFLSANDKYILSDGITISTKEIELPTINVCTKLSEPLCEGEDITISVYDGETLLATAHGQNATIELPTAELWSDETPVLYRCKVQLINSEGVLDEDETRFGIRSLSWSEEGFFVNGKSTLLRGGCIHHDNGILGGCSYYDAEYRKIKLLKEYGYNAVRISHNPASKNLLDVCDELGMYVMDEAFDMWFANKNKYDYGTYFMENYLNDITTMVMHGINHPSVVLYSIGNEVGEPSQQKGLDVASNMINLIHELDPSRPVTAGINFMVLMLSSMGKGLYDAGGLASNNSNKAPKSPQKEKENKSGSLIFNTMMTVLGKGINKVGNSKKADLAASPILDLLDICGYNYANGRYEKESVKHPGRIIVGSETYPQDIYDNWEKTKRLPYLIGDFMWTAWDYLGEAAIGSWNYEGISMTNIKYPWLLSCAGCIDIIGTPDAQAAYAATVWGKMTTPYIGVQPVNHPGIRVTKAAWRGTNAFDSWSWNSCDGNKAIVEVYSSANKIALYLNNEHIATKTTKKMKATFKLPYKAGQLTAIALDSNGKEINKSTLISADKNNVIQISAEDHHDNSLLVYVNINVTDSNGIVESNADTKLTITVEGGELIGLGSAKPNPELSYTGNEVETYYGRSLAVIKRLNNVPITITAITADGKKYSKEIN